MTKIGLPSPVPLSAPSVDRQNQDQPQEISRLSRLINSLVPQTLLKIVQTVPRKDITYSLLRFALGSTAILSFFLLYPSPTAFYGLVTPAQATFGACCTLSAYTELSSLRNQVRLHELCKDQSKQTVFLFATPDFSWLDTVGSWDNNILGILQNLSEHHTIVNIKANQVENINRALRDLNSTGKNPVALYIKAHGNPDGILLSNGPEETIVCNRYQGSHASDIRFDLMDKNASIILNSCSVGQDKGTQLNIAEEFQMACGPDQRIYAPTKNIARESIRLDNAKDCSFSFYEDTVFSLLGLSEATNITANLNRSQIQSKIAPLA